MAQDEFQRIKESFDDARDAMSQQKDRMLEDLRFSNPADPQQWDEKVRTARTLEAMPCYTFDQTNQYIAQVVNDSRMNKPQIQTVPAATGADQKTSDALDGMIRQIEYASDAPIAYDIAQEAAARVGRGWFRLLTEVVDPSYNLQELRIRPVIDCLSVIPGHYTMPDGSDMRYGFVESRMSRDAYKAKYGSKKTPGSWRNDDAGWFDDDDIRIAEYFEVEEAKGNHMLIRMPDGSSTTEPETDYWKTNKSVGYKREVAATFEKTSRTVRWMKMNGDDFIDAETTFPGDFIPLFPVHGYETWIEGKRSLCGMVRRMMDSQKAYNMERSAYIQMVALQPKAPYVGAWAGFSGLERFWDVANTSNQAYLPYNHLDDEGNPIPQPRREQPPNVGSAYAQNAQMAQADLQASVGMYRANLGAPSNETSGIAIKRREQQGDTANFHYIDNLARSMGHCGRVIVGAIPTVYADSEYGPRDVRTLGIDGKSNQIVIDPGMTRGHERDPQGTIHINPSVGRYDVRVKVGPAYANLREELSARLTEISRGNPQLGAALAPLLMSMMDMPEAEKVSKICMAMLPPQVQAAYDSGDNGKPEIPPQVQARLQQMSQALQQKDMQLKQYAGALENAAAEHTKAETDVQHLKTDSSLDAYKAHTDRLKMLVPLMPSSEVVSLTNQTLTESGIPIVLNPLPPPPEPAAAEPAGPDPHLQALTQMVGAIAQGQQQHSEHMQQIAALMAAPKQIVRDPQGKAVGVQPVQALHPAPATVQ